MSIIEVLYRSSKIMHGHSVKGLRMVDGLFQADRHQNEHQPLLLELLTDLDGCDSAAPVAQMEAWRGWLLCHAVLLVVSSVVAFSCGGTNALASPVCFLSVSSALGIGSALDLPVGFLSDRERARRPRPLHQQGPALFLWFLFCGF